MGNVSEDLPHLFDNRDNYEELHTFLNSVKWEDPRTNEGIQRLLERLRIEAKDLPSRKDLAVQNEVLELAKQYLEMLGITWHDVKLIIHRDIWYVMGENPDSFYLVYEIPLGNTLEDAKRWLEKVLAE